MSQYGYMKKPAPNRIAEERKLAGWTQQDLADAVGAHWITISKLERGKIKLTTEWMSKIGRALDIADRQLLRQNKVIAKALAIGEIKDEGKVVVLPESKWSKEALTTAHFDMGYWFAVDTTFYLPVLHRGDSVYLEFVSPKIVQSPSEANLNALTARLGFIELKKDRGVFGFLDAGSKPGLWDLYWPASHRILHNVRARAIAMVMGTICGFPSVRAHDLTMVGKVGRAIAK